ncbi:protein diaphanous homolog 2-like isoform X2 [Haliotis rufescens]|uniref:protein diaphanous homolog 2-like isoform X2 n=1 Tax=Haliotis rufescens TaxID=6454 RepID=UPI00201F141C|nr:protein diaphanous homolog 2-like isoform X2 [Haliotis rufescens]
MDRKEKDKRNSFLDKVGGTFRLGKDRNKQKSVSSYPKQYIEDQNGSQAEPSWETTVKGYTTDEVNARFEVILDDMNLTEEKKAPLRSRDDNLKRSMLVMHYKGKAKPRKGEPDQAEDFITQLRNADLKGAKRLSVLESLRVSLTSNPVSWVQGFGEQGLNAVLRNLTYCCDSKAERRSTYECVRCLKAYMNNKFGLMEILNHEEALTILSRTVDPSDPQTMLEAVRLLAAICLVPPNGHERALEGITVCGEIRSQERFIPIIMGMGMRDNLPMQLACIQLVNALVSTPDDLDFRLHLRNEIMRTGMIDLMPTLDGQTDDEVKTQVQIFHEHKDEDAEEFSHRYDNVHMEIDDSGQCFELIAASIKDTVSEPYFLSILQHLLTIRDDLYSRPQYYKLIEECVTQIVLHKSGVDPDFRHTKRFEIDVEPLLSSLSEKSKFEDSNVNIGEMNTKLEAALTAKQESEAKATSLDEKIKGYEQELAQLKEKISQGIGTVVSSALNKGPGGGPPPPPGGGPPPPPPPPPPPGGGPPPPPPPPPPPGGGPPPPPPPPPPGGGPPPPPPPPGAPRPPGAFSPPGAPSPPTNVLPFGMQPKKKYSTNTQTKRLNWNKVNARVLDKDSLWVKISEEAFESDILFKDLEECFAVKAPAKKETSENVDIKPKKKSKELRVLDPKAGQNLSILLGSIKVPYKEIKRRILAIDDENLSEAMLEQLLKYMPTPEQMNQIASMKDQYNDLAEPEQFAVEMSTIKRITPRLTSMLFKMRFSEIVADIKPDLVAATEACEEVKNSKKFARLLEFILVIGNYLNAGSRNAQSLGFEISFLSKLDNTKSQDGKTTLMHFLAQTVEEKHPDLVGFMEELTHTEKAARVSDETLQKNLKQMEKQVKQLDIDIKNISKTSSEGDRFAEVMEVFIKVASEQHDVLSTMYKKLDSLFKELAKYLCFDTKKYSVEDFFGDLKNFKESFNKAMKENAKMRETQEKIRRAKEAKEKAEREKKEKKARQIAILDMTTDDDQEGVMDNLLEALKTGSAFSVNREKRDGKRRTPRAAGAERRAQLARSRSRQNLLQLDSSTVKEINFDESHANEIPNQPPEKSQEPERKERRQHRRREKTQEESEAEKLLARLKEL